MNPLALAKTTRQIVAAVVGVVAVQASFAQTYPSKTVALMVPYPAGGVSDLIARKVNVALGKSLKQTVIIENLGGASGAIAAQKVLSAPSDGYYLFQGSPNELILAPLANAAVKYKAEDFRQVQTIAIASLAVMARKDLPANTADELSAYAIKMAKEGKPLTYASVGQGSFYHLLGEQMSKTIAAPMTHVPYKGGADVLRDLLGGQVDIFITPYGTPHVEMAKQGKIKILTALSPKRQSRLPDVPSVDESQSLKGFNYEIGTGYFVKKDTPEAIVQALHKALTEVLADEEVKAGLTAIGADPSTPLSLDAASKEYAKDTDKFRAIAKSINLQPL